MLPYLPSGIELLYTPHEVEGATMTYLQALMMEDSLKAVLRVSEYDDYKGCISACSTFETDVSMLELPWDIKQLQAPSYEQTDMVLDIEFVKRCDALYRYQVFNTLNQYENILRGL